MMQAKTDSMPRLSQLIDWTKHDFKPELFTLNKKSLYKKKIEVSA